MQISPKPGTLLQVGFTKSGTRVVGRYKSLGSNPSITQTHPRLRDKRCSDPATLCLFLQLSKRCPHVPRSPKCTLRNTDEYVLVYAGCVPGIKVPASCHLSTSFFHWIPSSWEISSMPWLMPTKPVIPAWTLICQVTELGYFTSIQTQYDPSRTH